MGFSENLQILRKKQNMSQEQLAEKLEVSRQAVSKWESGSGYPETEKLITICEIFDCSIDEILKGKFSEDSNGDKRQYENLMNRFSKGIALAIAIILVGVTIFMCFVGIPGTEEMKEKYGIKWVADIRHHNPDGFALRIHQSPRHRIRSEIIFFHKRQNTLFFVTPHICTVRKHTRDSSRRYICLLCNIVNRDRLTLISLVALHCNFPASVNQLISTSTCYYFIFLFGCCQE